MQNNERGETDTQDGCAPAAMVAHHVDAKIAQLRRSIGGRKLSFLFPIDEDNECLHCNSQNV